MNKIAYLFQTGIISFSEFEIAFRFKDEVEYLLSTFIDVEYMLAVR